MKIKNNLSLKGNSKNKKNNSVYKMLGSTAHSKNPRHPSDLYCTPPAVIQTFLQSIDFKLSKNIWEPFAGMGHISETLKANKYNVKSTDLHDWGYEDSTSGKNFLDINDQWRYDILSNPPYSIAGKVIDKALSVVPDGRYVIMLLRSNFYEGKRKGLLERHPVKYIYQSITRIQCAIGGDFEAMQNRGGAAISFSFFVWQKGYKGETIARRFN
jgi:hypothetical protein